MSDLNLFGMFVDAGLATAMAAALALLAVRRLLAAVGAYRLVWHPPLVDLSLFAVLWFTFAAIAVHFQDRLATLLG